MHKPDRLSGYCLLATLVLTLMASLVWPQLAFIAGACAWFAAGRLFRAVQPMQQVQVVVLLVLGGAGLIYGLVQTGNLNWWLQAVTSNLGLLSMLLAVSFLRLVALSNLSAQEQLPRGPKALWRTLFGVHLFGSVINFSAPVIMADRLVAEQPLSRIQSLVLARGFTLAALWSPFFASMGIVLVSAPGASLWKLMPVGLAVALVALLIAGWRLLQHPEAATTSGYPMHSQALFLPLFLAASVLILHLINQELAVLTLVALTALLLTLVLLVWRHGWLTIKYLRQHTEQALPGMSGETLLFLSAGVLAAGLGAAMQAAEFSLQLTSFGPWEAWLLLVVLVGISALGIHPLITIAAAGSLFAPWVDDPNLLALVFLMTWAMGLSLSPLSGTHLAMQGRYGIASYQFTRWNVGYIALLLLVQLLALYAYSFLFGD